MKKRVLLPAVLVLILLATIGGRAQRYLASIRGAVTDATGAVVPNADVSAEETSTHFKTAAKTNGAGVYTFAHSTPETTS